jgi:hypothetical protein
MKYALNEILAEIPDLVNQITNTKEKIPDLKNQI